PSPNRRDRTREPQGSAVWTYVWITASRTRRSLDVSSSAVAISVNMLTTSVMRQGSGKTVKPQPSFGSTAQSSIRANVRPPSVYPRLHDLELTRLQLEADIRPH